MAKKKTTNHDYSMFFAIIAIWVMIGGAAQCESAKHLEGIKHELIMLKYK